MIEPLLRQVLFSEKKYPVELVCDTMEGGVLDSYDGWPERLYIIEDYCVVYVGEKGPFGYKPNEVLEWMKQRFGSESE